MIEVVAAVIFNGDKFMIAQRNLKKSQGGLWEFPGGKIEPGETGEEALKREIREEFNAEISVGELITEVEHHYPEKDVKLYFYRAELVGEKLEVLEHEAIAWISKEEKDKYQFAGADDGVVERI
ncbi:MAG: (deoxy)nucleoside triphosphate pyrophosphohydrolase [Clostridia bacterium]|nr:(deoxy)nucleoside triphosphate pyrophosphohydrolase [Clostridia bacterium]